MTVPLDYQKWFVEEMQKEGVEVQTATVNTGHCANFTAAKEVADIVNQVVKGQLKSVAPVADAATGKEDIKEAILKVESEK